MLTAGLGFPDVPVPGCLDRFLETAVLLFISSVKDFSLPCTLVFDSLMCVRSPVLPLACSCAVLGDSPRVGSVSLHSARRSPRLHPSVAVTNTAATQAALRCAESVIGTGSTWELGVPGAGLAQRLADPVLCSRVGAERVPTV